MPTYDYECKSCGHNFEVFQSIMDSPVKKCPECGKAVRRLIGGGTGIIFKGSGFYATDSRKSASAKSTSTKSNDGSAITTEKSDSSSGNGAKEKSSSDKASSGKSEGAVTTTK